VDPEEMERTFNMGVGMIAILPAHDVDRALAVLAARHVDAWPIGEIVAGEGEVKMMGEYATA